MAGMKNISELNKSSYEWGGRKLSSSYKYDWNEIVDVLSEQYHFIVILNLESGSVIPVRYNTSMSSQDEVEQLQNVTTVDELKEYLGFGMSIEEYSRLEDTLDFDNIRMGLWDDGRFSRTFKWTGFNEKHYYELKVIGLDEAPYKEIVVGVLDVTESMLKEVQNRKNSRMVEALSDDYVAIFFADIKDETLRLYRCADEVVGRYGNLFQGKHTYSEVIHTYIDKCVEVSEDDTINKYINFKAFRDEVDKNNILSFVYTRVFENETRQYRVKAVKIEEDGEFLGIVLGFCDVEDEYRKDKETQAMLQDALEEAKHASASKSNFLFNMSHDIRTPMNAILGFAYLAGKEVDNPEKLLSYLQKIESSGRHLLGLINDVLDMARIENGRIELHETSVNLEENFNETVDMFRLDMNKKYLTFKYSLDIKDKMVWADGLRLRQIVFNLLGNSLKYTKEGGTVWFDMKQLPSDKNGIASYEITVRDTGIGMSEEFQKHLFELFEREDRMSVNGVQGTGLGLAITKRLVELMNGTIHCQSEIDKGTTFVCLVRLKVSDSDDVNTTSDELDMSLLEGKRVLLVEDNDLNREIAKTLLEEVGIIVDEATDGAVAVEMLGAKSNTYDVVLMDIQMPYMDGYKATRMIRNNELRTKSHIPIIAMTANAFEEDKRKALEAGMDAHIAKPVDMTELFREMIRLS
ncbi:MAG: response regulator [Lachnospiraceae bacterium]|nr:response regulator [Lachnospiraceae bacterium]